MVPAALTAAGTRDTSEPEEVGFDGRREWGDKLP
jgi:hypothetical protein